MKSVTLSDFIREIGDEAAAKLFGVKERTAKSWRLKTRLPRPVQANVIIEKSPVTFDGIYKEAGK